ncbi:hypothetical protein [Streptomyces sp. NPDC059455]|uniref:hypothetical protein n=1 Tax=Streptomyces sp. NPDC059455 TaxID=3346837 RepID=UPI0036B90E0B
MGVRTWIQDWPVYRRLTGSDPLGRGAAATSAAARERRSGIAVRTGTEMRG